MRRMDPDAHYLSIWRAFLGDMPSLNEPIRGIDGELSAERWTLTEDRRSFPRPDRQLLVTEIRESLRRALSRMEPRTAFILRHRFGLDGAETLTLLELGHRLGLSRERVRQIQAAGLAFLRQEMQHLADSIGWEAPEKLE